MADDPSLQVVQLTPPGRGAVAVLLVDGPGAVEAVAAHFRAAAGRTPADQPADRLVFGRFGPGPGEEVVVRRRADGPVEVCCHGGTAAVEMVRRRLIAAGCRAVDWRDWLRAGHCDAVAAEARIALADARTERTAAILLDQLQGALRREVLAIAQAVESGDSAGAMARLDALLARAPLGRHLAEPWRVVLAGRPNVGKSSLVNALLGYTRAIVHHEPGTTRDVVTAATAIEGWPIQLADTAGLRQGRGPVEEAGVALARQQLAEADLAVLVSDLSRPWCDEDAALAESVPGAMAVHNKCDLVPGLASGGGSREARPAGVVVSALTGQGIEELVARIAQRLVPEPPPTGAAVPFTADQIEAILSARQALDLGDGAACALRLAGAVG